MRDGEEKKETKTQAQKEKMKTANLEEHIQSFVEKNRKKNEKEKYIAY